MGAAVLAVCATTSMAAASWIGPTTISVQSASVFSPAGAATGLSMAGADNGAITAVWAQSANGDPADNAYGTRMLDGAWSAPVAVSSAGTGVVNPHVAVGSGDTPIAAWDRGAFGSRAVQGIRYTGGRWSGEATMAPIGGNGTDVIVAADGTDTGIAMWTHLDAGNYSLQWSRHSGGTWSAAADLPGMGTQPTQGQLASGAPGQVTAAWVTGFGTAVNWATATNGTWGAVTTYPANTVVSQPSLAANASGAAAMAWSVTPNVVHAARRSTTGAWGPDEVVSPVADTDLGPVAAIDGSGTITIAWVRQLPDNTKVLQAARSTALGWTAPVDVSAVEPAGFTITPSIAVNAAGQATLVWNGKQGTLDVMRAATLTSAGWGPPATISGAATGEGPDTIYPYQVVVDPLGRATVGWIWNHAATKRAEVSRLQGVPNAPTGATATAGDAAATVSWTAPAYDGGAAVTAYRVTSLPGGKTCTTTGAITCTVSGLSNGTDYTFTVAAGNAVGTGPESSATNAVMPRATPRVVGTLRATMKVRNRTITTTGSVAKGVTKVSQRLTAPKKKARTAKCSILAAPRTGADRAYRCTIRVPAAKWKLVTEARDPLGVVARSTRSLRVR